MRSISIGLGLLVTFLSAAGCGSTTTSDPPGGGPTEDSSSLQPPERPAEKNAGEGTTHVVYAIDKFFLGDTDRNGAASKTAWKSFGYDIDGKTSTGASTDLCKVVNDGDPTEIYPDGDDGIDNAWGSNILPLLRAINVGGVDLSNLGGTLNDQLSSGSFTILVDIEGLGAKDSYDPLKARLFVGGNLGKAPSWDGTDAWPVMPEFLNNPPDLDSTKVAFTESYVNSNVWVSGTKTTVSLSLAVSGYSISLPIQNAVITMKLDADRKAATEGTISGVMDVDQFVDQVKAIGLKAAHDIFCEQGDQYAGLVRRFADIMKDGSQDPTKTCDGISIGLGFNMKQVELGPVAEAQPVEGTPPCE